MSSIFVQISSYHDFELPRTIIDCLKKSSGKNIITFGVHIVYYEKDEIKLPDISNLKYEKHKAPDNIGVGIGRFNANELYSGEDYYLQIDSHMRFAQGWDEMFIGSYQKYLREGLNPVLSAYPGGYEYEDYVAKINSDSPVVPFTDFIQELSFENDSYTPHQRAVENLENNIFTKSISAASMFSSGEIAKIKPNKKMFFWGEEILTAIRLYTSGYDLLLPETQNLYHLYNNGLSKGFNTAANLRRNPRDDFPDKSYKKEVESKSELARIIINRVVGNQELGSVRALENYERYADIDFTKKTAKLKTY
jgi:hypothetical protein